MTATIVPSPTRRVARIRTLFLAYLVAVLFVLHGALTAVFADVRCSGLSMHSLASGNACVRANLQAAAAWAVAGVLIVVLAHLLGRRWPR